MSTMPPISLRSDRSSEFLQEAKVEARLGDLVQSPLAFLKILLGLSLSLLTAFDEPLEAFAAEKSMRTFRFSGNRPAVIAGLLNYVETLEHLL
jgi:hypothetical protein